MMADPAKTPLRNILDRLKELEALSTDVALADPLETTKRNVAAWKERDTIPWDILAAYSEKKGVSFEWLIRGRGPRFVADMVAEPGAIYEVATNQDTVYTISGDVFRALHELDKHLSPEKFVDVVRLLHRDMLEHKADQVPYEKVLSMVKLAV